MFRGFDHVWTPVMLARDLRANQARRAMVADTPVALFRTAQGGVSALVDRCPHRGVSLALGRVEGDCLRCPFHGWKLDGTGAVREVPWNPDAKLETLRGWPVPVREAGGLVWVHTAVGVEAQGEPYLCEELERPGTRLAATEVMWDCHWTRAMENMLDSPHLPFVHAKTIGRGMKTKLGGRMDIDVEPQPWGFKTKIQIEGQPQQGQLSFLWPNTMRLDIGIPGKTFMMQVSCIPVEEGGVARTRMFLLTVRDFLTWGVFDAFFNRTNLKIAAEDKHVVESSSPAEVPQASEEQSVRTDGPTLRFRKRYFAELCPDRPQVVAPASLVRQAPAAEA